MPFSYCVVVYCEHSGCSTAAQGADVLELMLRLADQCDLLLVYR